MDFLRRFFSREGCKLGCGLRDHEPGGTHVDAWLTTRSPNEILKIARFAKSKRLPIAGWVLHIDEVQAEDAAFLVTLARFTRTLEVRCPPQQNAVLMASIRSTRCLDLASRILVGPPQ